MGEVRLEVDGAVAVLTVSSPEVRNGLTAEMGRQMMEHCEAIDAELSIGAAVIRGDAGTFCSGADTRTWSGDVDPASDEAFGRTSAVYGAFARVGALQVPTVAAVRGRRSGRG